MTKLAPYLNEHPPINAMFETNRIKLRAPEPQDLDTLYLWENDVKLWKYGNTINPLSRFALSEFINNSSENIFDSKQLRLMIVFKSNGESIGAIDLYDFDPLHKRIGVGILIDLAHQRQGFAKEALGIIKKYCVELLGVHQVYAHIPMQNVASIALFASCGFIQSGVLRDWLRVKQSFEDVAVMQFMCE